jgi:phosphate transport system substrate-binding protein
MKTKIFQLVVLAITLVLSACSDSPKQQNDAGKTQLSGSIRIDGSSTVYPITEAVAEEFRTECPKVKITIGISGTGGGFKKFSRGETDISDASRPIKEKEKEACQENGIEYISLTIAYDGMAVLINPQNDWVDYLTIEDLKKMWEPEAQNNITKWSQIRPEWPEQELHLFGPGVASGTFDYFTKVIVGESGKSRGDFTASEDDNVLVQGIASDKYALGFFGLAYYEENMDKLKLAGVDNGNGPVLPTIETVKNGTYAPLSRPVFIYISSNAVKRPEVTEFVEFYLKNVFELVKEVGYVPLPQEEYNKELEKFRQFADKHK